MSGFPSYGTAEVICANRRCSHRHTELERSQEPHPTMKGAYQTTCPKCDGKDYYFDADLEGGDD